jgi:transposase InsO family protein
MIGQLVKEATLSGARLERAVDAIGLSIRTLQRWNLQDAGSDRRRGPSTDPSNKLTPVERQNILDIANSEEFRDLSPKQIVPQLADQGTYLASESSFYRVLRAEDCMTHRETSRPATSRKPKEQVATGPCQVWSWDITYLKSPILGQFFYLYLIMDVWSRKIVASTVYSKESSAYSARLFLKTCLSLSVDPEGLVLHSDNGGPMKGATMLATLQRLGVVPSFSRPQVSDDNPYSESLFRTMKYRPGYPSQPFSSLAAAQTWVDGFVGWYNTEHLHSSICFVTPDDRHFGREQAILANRSNLYEAARLKNPNRWSRNIRNWEPVETVYLNPESTVATNLLKAA